MALTLGIETSCDETSVAVVADGRRILANVIHSQVDVHEAFGGVVPELAARDHLVRLPHLLDMALEQAKVAPQDLDLLAVTRGRDPDMGATLVDAVDRQAPAGGTDALERPEVRPGEPPVNEDVLALFG